MKNLSQGKTGNKQAMKKKTNKVEKKFRKLAMRIKSSALYTIADGECLGIESKRIK